MYEIKKESSMWKCCIFFVSMIKLNRLHPKVTRLQIDFLCSTHMPYC
jgi:hypothetical protein